MGRGTGRGPVCRTALAAVVLSFCSPTTSPAWRTAFDATRAGRLLCAWAPEGGEPYAVGGVPGAGWIGRRNGDTWSAVDLGVAPPTLHWIHGLSATDIVVVGAQGTALHFESGRWVSRPTGTTEDLWGVWCAAPDDRWAVGGSGRPDGVPTVRHWDGAQWSASPVPTLQRANVHAFFKVWGTSATDVFVVGQRGVVLHWDGRSWTEMFAGASDDLISLWGTGPRNVVAVGGRGNAVVSRWDGTQWTTRSLAPLSGLNGIWMRAPGVAHVAGVTGTLARVDLTTATFAWTDESVRTTLDFHGIYGDTTGRLTAVGGNLGAETPPYVGLAMERTLGSTD